MFGKNKKDQQSSLAWDPAAETALEQALGQAPVPAMLRGRVKSELKKAAEFHARQQGHTVVTAEDLMNGMLAKLPANMKTKVEEAMKKGPQGLEDLKKNLPT